MKSSSWSQDIQDTGALAMVAVAMMVIGYLAFMGNETATGALISVISAGTGYYLRGRIAAPETGLGSAVTVTGERGSTVNVAPTQPEPPKP